MIFKQIYFGWIKLIEMSDNYILSDKKKENREILPTMDEIEKNEIKLNETPTKKDNCKFEDLF